jgi:hypothetical protein
MEQICHRCHAALNESDPFCAHCGSPQVRYEPPDEPVFSASSPPIQRLSSRNPDAVSWKDAIILAALIAVPAGLLCSLIGLEAIWVLIGSVATIFFYSRGARTPLAANLSWRIGALFGIFAAVVAAATDGSVLLIQRYVLHQGATLDRRYHDLGLQLSDQLTRSNPDAAAVLPGFLHFWVTPDGAAAMVLINTVGTVISILLFAAAGGAIGARLTARIAHSSAR